MLTQDPTACRDQCGAQVADDDAAIAAGWSCLSIAGGWRCGPCSRALALAAGVVGTPGAAFVDPLPPHSRGALPRETASTIAPSVVKP